MAIAPRKSDDMKLTVSQIKYLLVLSKAQDSGGVRISDMAKTLDIKRSSVFNMLKKLAEAGLVVKNDDKTVSLTEKGKSMAAEISLKAEDYTAKLQEHFGISPENSEECAVILISRENGAQDEAICGE